MKKVLAIILAAVLVLQAGAITVLADTSENEKQTITISNICASLLDKASSLSSTIINALGISEEEIKILKEEWTCQDEYVISGENIEVQGGIYSYKLVIRSNGTLTFDNDLDVLYQGINGKYQLNYEIDETDNHIMIVTGNFENIIVKSPLLEKLPQAGKEWVLSHISDDSYFYNLNLRTKEGFTFANKMKLFFNSKLYGYSIDYVYDLLSDKQTVAICAITKCDQIGQEHVWDKDYTVDIPATCEAEGSKSIHCSRCAAIKEGSAKVIEKAAHSWNDGKVKKAATALAAGSKLYTCTKCGETKTDAIKKLTPTIKLSATKKTIKVKKYFALAISKLAKGDKIASVKSSNTKILAVKKAGTNKYKVTGKAKGKANIVVTLKSGKKAKCTVTVK